MKEVKISEAYIDYVENFYNLNRVGAETDPKEMMYLGGYLDALRMLTLDVTVNEDGTIKIER